MSKRYSVVCAAYAAGYRVDETGAVISPQRVVRKLLVRRDGYRTFNIKHDGMSFPVLVHQLAAFQQFGEAISKDDTEIRHKDGDKSNNAPSNMLLGTHKMNMLDVEPAQRLAHAMRAARTTAKISDDEIVEIRRTRPTLKEIMRRFNVSKCCASYARSGKTYKRRLDTGC